MFCNKGAFPFWIGSFGHMWPQQRDSDAENKPAEVTKTRRSQRGSVQSLQRLICSQSTANPANSTNFCCFVPSELYFVFPLHCRTKRWDGFFFLWVRMSFTWPAGHSSISSLVCGFGFHVSVIKQITHVCSFVPPCNLQSFSPYFYRCWSWGLMGINRGEIEFFKCSLSGTCSWKPLEGVFCRLSICFFPIGCDIKLNRILTGGRVGNEAAWMHTHQLRDLTCYGSSVHK